MTRQKTIIPTRDITEKSYPWHPWQSFQKWLSRVTFRVTGKKTLTLVPCRFWRFFSNLSKILIFSDHSPLEVSTKPLHLPPGSSAGFTPRARSASLMGGMGWDGTEDQKCPSNFFILCEYIGNLYTYKLWRNLKDTYDTPSANSRSAPVV